MITKEYIFSGIVQGMGFRPTALRLATELGITGTVCNTGGRVTLTATGEGAALTAFAKRLCRAFSIYQYEVNELPFQPFQALPSPTAVVPGVCLFCPRTWPPVRTANESCWIPRTGAIGTHSSPVFTADHGTRLWRPCLMTGNAR